MSNQRYSLPLNGRATDHGGGNIYAGSLFFCIAAVTTAYISDSSELIWISSWLGSMILLLLTVTGKVFTFPNDLAVREQAMRPWVLLQTVFVGYNCLTSVFCWMDVNGYFFLAYNQNRVSTNDANYVANAQRLYLIGHVGLVYGMALAMRFRPQSQFLWAQQRNVSMHLLGVAAVAAIGMILTSILPGLGQFSEKMRTLSTVAAAASLGVAYRETGSANLLLPIITNVVLLITALSSGWKSEVLVLVLLNASVFYTTLPRLTVFSTLVILVLGTAILPPMAQKIREERWFGGGGRWESLIRAIDKVANRDLDEALDDTWSFLTQRLSEISLFAKYLRAVPTLHPYYETEIVGQALTTPIPRIMWPEKQDTEGLVRQRVLELGIVEAYSNVSAKPQYIVDGYLTYGVTGVALAMFLYGLVCVFVSKICESLLGGYLLGGVAFNGLFGILWTGNCFEFIVNGVFWSMILVFILHYLARGQNMLIQVK